MSKYLFHTIERKETKFSHIYEGNISRQIGTLSISNKNRKWATSIDNKHPSKPHYVTHRAMVRESIRINLDEIRNANKKEAAAHYGIHKFRSKPENRKWNP